MGQDELLRRRGVRRMVVSERFVVRSVAVRAEVPLVGSGIRIEDDHPPVAVAIRNPHLVGLGIDRHVGWETEHVRVVAAVWWGLLTDLKEDLPVGRELQDAGVLPRARRDPHVALMVDGHPVFFLEPVVPRDVTATPAPDDVSFVVELDDARRWCAAAGPRWVSRGSCFPGGQRPGAMRNPQMVLRVDHGAEDHPEHPIVRKRLLRPRRVPLELRYPGRVVGGRGRRLTSRLAFNGGHDRP